MLFPFRRKRSQKLFGIVSSVIGIGGIIISIKLDNNVVYYSGIFLAIVGLIYFADAVS